MAIFPAEHDLDAQLIEHFEIAGINIEPVMPPKKSIGNNVSLQLYFSLSEICNP